MGFISLNSKKGDAAINLPHHSGVPGFPEKWATELILHDDEAKLEIRPRLKRGLAKDSVYLPYDRIVGVALTSSAEIRTKGKSVLGRAMLGGIVLGPLGAIVGGMSGTGVKSNQAHHKYLIINYKSGDAGEVKVLSFIDNTLQNALKFVEMLKSKSGIVELSEDRVLL